MRSIAKFGALLALAAAAPLSAQGSTFRTGDIISTNRIPTTVMGQVLGQDQQAQQGNRKSDRVPPGQLPPAGMCRIWIDGVPPGQQPAPTDCQTAVATKPANARVIWGDQSAFPGKANGKFNKHGKDKVKHDDRDDDDDDDEIEAARSRRGGVLGSVIPSATQQKSVAKKGNGKGKGRD